MVEVSHDGPLITPPRTMLGDIEIDGGMKHQITPGGSFTVQFQNGENVTFHFHSFEDGFASVSATVRKLIPFRELSDV